MTLKRRLLAVGVAAWLTACVRTAEAQDTVVLVEPGQQDAKLMTVMRRLRAELESVDYSVAVRSAGKAGANGRARPFRVEPIVATVELQRGEDGTSIRISVRNELSGETIERELEPKDADMDESVIALRTTEVVRASLAKLTILPRELELPPKAEPSPEPKRPRSPCFVSLASGVLASALSQQRLGFTPVIRGSFIPEGHWGARISIGMTLPPQSFPASEGEATAWEVFGLAEGMFRLRLTDRVGLFVTGGAGAHHLIVEGSSAAYGYRARSGYRTLPLFAGGLGIRGKLNERFAVVVDASLASSIHTTRVLVAGKTVADLGPFIVLGAVGLELRL